VRTKLKTQIGRPFLIGEISSFGCPGAERGWGRWRGERRFWKGAKAGACHQRVKVRVAEVG